MKNPATKAQKILIVGNSAAGTAAVETVRRMDPECDIVQLTDELHPLYSRCLLPYYLAGTLPREKLLYRDAGFHASLRVRLHAGKRAVRLDTDRRQVHCDDGSAFDYDKVLIATGASAKLPDNIPSGVDGVHVLRNLDDAEAIRGKLVRARNAVILGGGLIGIKAAIALAERGVTTRVIVRSDRVLSQMIDATASQMVLQRLRQNGIEVLEQTDVTEIEDSDKTLVAVKTNQGQRIPCELLIVAKGVQPNTECVEGTEIKKRRGLETNPYMQTSLPDVFAAGDVAETFDITAEGYAVNALWTCAVQQGRIAGLNMTGRKTAYDGAIGMNSLNICGIPMMAYGITAPKDESKYRTLILENPEKCVYKKIILEKNRIKGVLLLGRIDNGGVLLSLIQRKADVEDFEEELLSDQFRFGNLLRTGETFVFQKYQRS
jgi:NAD(P)H-nitrite reductase large subunit